MSDLHSHQYPLTAPHAPSHDHLSSSREKKEVFSTVQQLPTTTNQHGDAISTPPDWSPGLLSRFPWLGLSAVLIILSCSAASLAVLAVSDGRSQTNWPQRIQPSVILSGLNNVANISFSIAIANGVAIAWWRKALRGATIKELHKSWSFSTSVKEAVLAGKAFNVIALAALTAKLAIIDGMLMQSATTTYVGQDNPVNISTLQGWANQNFPLAMASDLGVDGPLQWNTDREFMAWESHPTQLPLTAFRNCDGQCFFKVPAAGFVFDCNETSAAVYVNSVQDSPKMEVQNGTGPPRKLNGDTSLFNMDFGAYYQRAINSHTRGSHLTMDVTYSQLQTRVIKLKNGTQADSCAGTTSQRSCALRPAILRYPVMVQNYSVGTKQIQGISIGITEDSFRASTSNPGTQFDRELMQQQGFELVKYLDDVDHELTYCDDCSFKVPSTLATLATVLGDAFKGSMGLGVTPDVGLSVNGPTGTATQWFSRQPVSFPDLPDLGRWGNTCGYWFDDPMNPARDGNIHKQSIVASINQVMFAIATNITTNLTASSTVPWQTYDGTLYKDAVHYRTRWAYAAGAVASTFFCVLCILPVYWGYWQLGRKVSLGPFEIAHAFRSPLTVEAANGGIEDVIQQVGDREVQYGHIVAGDARGVVGVAEPEYVQSMTDASSTRVFRERVPGGAPR